MAKASSVILLLVLTACSGLPQRQAAGASAACAGGDHSYSCQIERHQRAT